MSPQIAVPARLAVLLIVLAGASCRDATSPRANGGASTEDQAAPPPLPLALAPQTVTRDKGQPVTVSFPFRNNANRDLGSYSVRSSGSALDLTPGRVAIRSRVAIASR
jgi:hypothetical protein